MTAHDPDSACTRRSYARLCEIGPPGPYPSISTGMTFGCRSARSAAESPMPRRRTRCEVRHECVGAVEQPMQQVDARGRLRVERHRLLAAVAPHEVGGQAARPVDDVVVVAREVAAVGVLHLDDAGAEVGRAPACTSGAATACSMATIVTPDRGAGCGAGAVTCSDHHAAVDRQHLARDVGPRIRGQEDERTGELGGASGEVEQPISNSWAGRARARPGSSGSSPG